LSLVKYFLFFYINAYTFKFIIMALTYKLLIHKEPEGLYTVTVPALPGCITFGENIEHAIEMAKEAIELYIEELQERGEVVPDDSNTIEYSLNIPA